MVDRLTAFLDAGALVLDGDGEPELVACRPPVAALRRALRGARTGCIALAAEAAGHTATRP